MFIKNKGDAAFEWILVATIGTLVFGAIVYNLSQTSGLLGNSIEGGITAFGGYAPGSGPSSTVVPTFTPSPTPPAFAAYQFGGLDSDTGARVTTDTFGNVYIAGSFYDTVDFDPGGGVFNMTAATGNSQEDIFVVKMNSSGSLVWVKQLASSGTSLSFFSERVYGIASDSAGNVYIAGAFDGTADFDPGAGTVSATSVGTDYVDAFLWKLDSSGNYVWHKVYGSASSSSRDTPAGVGLDGSGNIYWGYASNLAGYAEKLSSNGTGGYDVVWTKQLGQSSLGGFAVDSSGNSYALGKFSSTRDFDPGAGTSQMTAIGSWDIFIQKLDSSGSYVWAKQFGGAGVTDIGAGDVAVDGSGNVYATGYFPLTVDFDPSANTVNRTSAGGNDAFIVKLDNLGALSWAVSLGGSGWDQGWGIAVDSSGAVYGSGELRASSPQAYVTKLNSSGNSVWISKAGGGSASNSTYAYDVAVNTSGVVYSAGQFTGTVDFDPGAGTFELIGGTLDAFLWQLNSLGGQ